MNQPQLLIYTPQKKKLLACSFANFEMTRWSTGKAYVSFLSQLSSSINFQMVCRENAQVPNHKT